MSATLHYSIFETAAGFCGIGWRGERVALFRLPAKTAQSAERHVLRRAPDARPSDPSPSVSLTIAAARRYFDGEAADLSGVPIDLTDADPAFIPIYEAARGVGWGRTTTYGALAKEVGLGPQGARDVGLAMATNPVPLIVPCHRVLAAGGKVGGFSAPGGAATKLRMLALEGARLPATPPTQESFAF